MRRFLAILAAAACLLSVGHAEGERLNLRGLRPDDATASVIAALIDDAGAVAEVDLTAVPIAPAEAAQLTARYPGVRFLWSMNVFGVGVDQDTEVLDFGDRRVTDYDLLALYLRCFPNLKKVLLYKSVNFAADRDMLCAAFPEIDFGFTVRFLSDKYAVETADVTAFSSLQDGAPPHLYDYHMWWLKYCPNLVALDLGHNGLRDLSFLRDAPKLRVLILADNDVSDISPLADLPDLEYAELFLNHITDLSPLRNLKNLKDLNLSFNDGVTDITPLLDLPNLERLWLSWNTAIPAEQIARLRERYPDAEIVTRSYGSTGVIYLDDGSEAPGWRDHPRYPVIYHMFNHGGYVGWDWDFHTCPWCLPRFSEQFD